MLLKEKFMKDKAVLEKIGISDEIVKKWKRKGLKITYPTKQNPHWLKSADGEVFIENADKFVPPLTKKETKLYIRYPTKLRNDFLKNVRFFKKFCNFVYKKQKLVNKLEEKERVAVLLSLIYLFQRAMDYHYYHWDRYLVYENYPQTPVGYWWKKLRILYSKVTKKKFSKQKPPEDLLKLLALDKKTLKKFKIALLKNDFRQFQKALKAIKVFEDAQQKEIESLVNFKFKEEVLKKTGFGDILKGTGFPMLVKFWEDIEKHPELIKKAERPKIKKIMKLHPIIGARRILLTPALKYFDEEIFSQFEKEIKRWL